MVISCPWAGLDEPAARQTDAMAARKRENRICVTSLLLGSLRRAYTGDSRCRQALTGQPRARSSSTGSACRVRDRRASRTPPASGELGWRLASRSSSQSAKDERVVLRIDGESNPLQKTGIADEVPGGHSRDTKTVESTSTESPSSATRVVIALTSFPWTDPRADGLGYSVPVEQFERIGQIGVQHRPGGSGVEHRKRAHAVELDLDMNAGSLRGMTRILVEIARSSRSEDGSVGPMEHHDGYRRCRNGLTCGASSVSFRRKAARDSSTARSAPSSRATHLPAWLPAFLRNHSMLSAALPQLCAGPPAPPARPAVGAATRPRPDPAEPHRPACARPGRDGRPATDGASSRWPPPAGVKPDPPSPGGSRAARRMAEQREPRRAGSRHPLFG